MCGRLLFDISLRYITILKERVNQRTVRYNIYAQPSSMFEVIFNISITIHTEYSIIAISQIIKCSGH